MSDWCDREGATIWLDLLDPTSRDLEQLGDELGLHSLAVEDAVQKNQRPKLDRYSGHLFFNAYSVSSEEGSGILEAHEVTAFLTPNVLATVHRGTDFDIAEVVTRWDDSSDLAVHGVGFLFYGLIDYIVDSYFSALLNFDDIVDALSDEIFELNGREADAALRRTFDLRRSLLTARRVVTPMREVLNTMMRRDLHVLNSDLLPYYQDVYDHALRAAEMTDTLRDMIGTIRETHLALQGNRMNLIMKKVTSWAAIIAVPTAVTGFYGQNVPYPGFGSTAGFWVSIVVMIGVSAVLYTAFRRRDWL
ncbi:MAG TPA: magnesium transporter CorA family protein [Actinocrinis sp.]|nr:magnesium transporter CorA family protein [Actinocrinis sp.]